MAKGSKYYPMKYHLWGTIKNLTEQNGQYHFAIVPVHHSKRNDVHGMPRITIVGTGGTLPYNGLPSQQKVLDLPIGAQFVCNKDSALMESDRIYSFELAEGEATRIQQGINSEIKVCAPILWGP